MNTEKFKNDYLNGMSIKDIKAKYGFGGDGTVYYHLERLGISKRGKIKHYDNPFLNNSPERDYWLGWIFSDGCIVKTARQAYVYLACLDYDIILKFKEFCGDRAILTKFQYTTPKSKEVRTMHKVIINSQELVQYFSDNFHTVGKKSRTLGPGINISWDLLRGALDGDGSFKKGVVLTSNSKTWIDKVSTFYDSFGLHYTVVKDSAYRIGIYKKEDIKKVFNYLYNNATMFLDRKKTDLSRLAK